jgi:hypothetical protein
MAERDEHLIRQARARTIVERAAEELKEIIHEAALALEPFPPFPGAFFTNALEAEPGAAASPERGCVVVCADGELREFQMGMDFSGPTPDPALARRETLKPLTLSAQDYVVYAFNAIEAMTRAVDERRKKER